MLCDGPRETRLAHLDRVPLVHRGLVRLPGGERAGQRRRGMAAGGAAGTGAARPGELLERFGRLARPLQPARPRGRRRSWSTTATTCRRWSRSAPRWRSCRTRGGRPSTRRRATAATRISSTQGRLLGATFDRVVIYEDAYIRGREPGDITRLISQGIRDGDAGADGPVRDRGGRQLGASRRRSCSTPRSRASSCCSSPTRSSRRFPGSPSGTAAGSGRRSSTSLPARPAARRDRDRPEAGRAGGGEGRAASAVGVAATRDIAAGRDDPQDMGPQPPQRSRHTMQVERRRRTSCPTA